MIHFQFLKSKLSGNNVERVELSLFVFETEKRNSIDNRLKRLKIKMKRVNCEKDEFEEKVKRMTCEYE